MGGMGSGRSEWGSRRTVGQCLTLDASRLSRLRVLTRGVRTIVGLGWGDPVSSSIGIEVNTIEGPLGPGWLRLLYALKATGEAADYPIELDVTEPNYGGVRWWFLCPGCGRRVGKLYLPPAELRFACRACHRLGYASQKVNYRGDAMTRLIAGRCGCTVADVQRLMNLRR